MSRPGAHEVGNTGAAQRDARALLVALHAATRAIRLYPVENAAVQKALAELSTAVAVLRQREDGCELRAVGEYLFVNDTRVRLMMDNYAAMTNILALFRQAGIGGVHVRSVPAPSAWTTLLTTLQSPLGDDRAGHRTDESDDDRLDQLSERLNRDGLSDFELLPVTEAHEPDPADAPTNQERSRRTFARTMHVAREVMTSARLGRSRGLKRVKRAVQDIVDAVITDSASMMGMTNLREFDDYTFVHSVNVCILSVALGRRLGLTKAQLLDLGLAALMHDVGKASLPLEVLNKRGQFTDDERRVMQSHPWHGVLALFDLPVGVGRPWRAVSAAFEHHMRIDLSGYPHSPRTERMSLFSKIIAVADGFDAATTARVYQETPYTPAEVLRGMRDNPRLGLDLVVVKAFINLTGIYPAGTVVVLDTFELAIVMHANDDPPAVARPIVRLLSDGGGNRLPDGPLCDLTEQNDLGVYLRTIIRTEDPDRHGIRVADYFA